AISGGGRTSANDYLAVAKQFNIAAVFHKPIDRKALLKKVGELTV
ncbi:MAG: response regulator, partial [Fibrobacter sp.]|nr:response regulator [Fibrobacter sp.]